MELIISTPSWFPSLPVADPGKPPGVAETVPPDRCTQERDEDSRRTEVSDPQALGRALDRRQTSAP